MNVYELAQKRIEYIFDHFDNVLVAFSGGKDSTVCLAMCYEYAKNHNKLGKLSMYHMDYEAQYQMTTDFVDETFKRYTNIRKYWCCLPIQAQCACNMDSGHWEPWNPNEKSIWVRDMPEYPYVINKDNLWFPFIDGIDDYEFQTQFCKEFGKKFGSTAVVIGIRSVESLSRWRTVNKDRVNQYDNKKWTTVYKDSDPLVINAYPIADWKTEDIWVYFNKFNEPYNKIYDLYYKAGLSIYQMRVASPFNTSATESLKLYKVIDPQTWGKMISRVNGVSFVGLYGSTTAMAGYGKIRKPDRYTWKEYYEFLFKTLNTRVQNSYTKKLDLSIRFWREIGGILDKELLDQVMNSESAKIYGASIGTRNYQGKIKECLKFEIYPDDLPECTKSFCSYPSYKRMCIAIMKNDYFLKTCGFGQNKEEIKMRKAALEKYKNL